MTDNIQYDTTQLYGVRYVPSDGPAALVLVDALDPADAIANALRWFHDNDMDAVTRADLRRPIRIGIADEIVLVGDTRDRVV